MLQHAEHIILNQYTFMRQARHLHHASKIILGAEKDFIPILKFISKASTPDGLATCSIALRITTLNHKVLDNTMERDTIVVAILTARIVHIVRWIEQQHLIIVFPYPYFQEGNNQVTLLWD